jgi:hypothetical protein
VAKLRSLGMAQATGKFMFPKILLEIGSFFLLFAAWEYDWKYIPKIHSHGTSSKPSIAWNVAE